MKRLRLVLFRILVAASAVALVFTIYLWNRSRTVEDWEFFTLPSGRLFWFGSNTKGAQFSTAAYCVGWGRQHQVIGTDNAFYHPPTPNCICDTNGPCRIIFTLAPTRISAGNVELTMGQGMVTIPNDPSLEFPPVVMPPPATQPTGDAGDVTSLNEAGITISIATGQATITETGPTVVRVILLPHWILAALFGVLPLIWAPYVLTRLLVRRRRRSRNCCAQCGYDLRATHDRCPECGEALVPICSKASAPG